MGSSVLGVGQSALNAAQTGLVTTGHNIANVNTPGYSRQVVIQGAAPGQNIGVGYVGKGTEVTTVRRIYNEFLQNQVLSSQTSKGAVDSYYAQIKQIDNMLADPTSGVSSAMQDFFKGVQDVASNPSSAASRQAMLSSAESLAARFQSAGTRLDELRQGVNGQIGNSINAINSYAQQIASLNDAIEKAQGTAGESRPANDLLDQRDQVISDLSKEIKVSVVKQGNSYNVFMGTGQALTVGTQVFKLQPASSPTDSSKVQVAYVSSNGTSTLPDASLTGGRLGGLLEFRNNSLEPAQNALGRVATGLALTFNKQHQLGQDQLGALGGAFFSAAAPQVNANGANDANTTPGSIAASITDASKLTTSDYRVQYDGTNYTVTRVSDNKQVYAPSATFPSGEIDGITLANTGTFTAGEKYEFLVKPTANGATGFKVGLSDIAKIAVAAPIRTAIATTNTGTGKISAGVVSSKALMPSGIDLAYNAATDQITSLTPSTSAVTVTTGGVTKTYPAGSTLIPFAPGDALSIDGIPVTFPTGANATYTLSSPTASTLTYSGGSLTGFPAYQDITVTHADGSKQTIAGASPAASVPYASGDTISFGGVSVTVSGAPVNGDKFTIGPNTGGVGDNRNALLLGGLQTANTLEGGTQTYQNAYTHMVSQVGNKTRELEVNSKAEEKMLEAATAAQQAESGVNLDEEAANLMRYQQAYQAAAKVMQTAGQLFELLLTLGG